MPTRTTTGNRPTSTRKSVGPSGPTDSITLNARYCDRMRHLSFGYKFRRRKAKKGLPRRTMRDHSLRKARMGSIDAARWAGKNAAVNVTMVMPANATTIVRGSLELKPYSIERKVVATASDQGM